MQLDVIASKSNKAYFIEKKHNHLPVVTYRYSEDYVALRRVWSTLLL
jgi:hypothetical protein